MTHYSTAGFREDDYVEHLDLGTRVVIVTNARVACISETGHTMLAERLDAIQVSVVCAASLTRTFTTSLSVFFTRELKLHGMTPSTSDQSIHCDCYV
jgi:hypothetical protein